MNKVILVGRLCSDPELRYVGDKNIALTRFLLAVSRNYKNNEGNYDCDFIECDLWDKRAEVFCQYMSKGELVGIEGKLRLNKYTNENGEKRSMIRVKVDSFNFIPSSKRKETNNTFSSKDFFPEEIFDNEISESEIPF